jgi:hypothetical protein
MSARTLTTAIALLALAYGIASGGPGGRKVPPKKDPPVDKTPPPPPAPPPEPEPPPRPLPKPGEKVRIVAVLDVHVGEGVAPEIEKQFQKDLDKKLDSNKYWLAPRWRVRDLMANSSKWVDGCLLGTCLHEVKVQTGADIVLLASLTGSGTSFASVITLVRTDNGRALTQMVERCDVCTVNEQLGAAIAAAVKLLQEVPDKLPDEVAAQTEALEAIKVPYEQKVKTLEDQQHHHGAGMTMTITGVVAAAVGSALYFAENHPSYGLATAAAGGALAVGGVVVLSF